MKMSRGSRVVIASLVGLSVASSPAAQELIRTLEGGYWPNGTVPLLPRLELLDDRDGDGLGEFMVGDVGYSDRNPDVSGRVSVVSSLTGLELAGYSEPGNNGVGMAAAVLGDMDGDGVLDFGSASWTSPGGGAWIWSGSDLSLLFRDLVVPKLSINRIGDVNGDGLADAAYGSNPVRVVAGGTFEHLYTVGPDVPSFGFGWRIVGLGDVDGDDVPDFAVSAPNLGFLSGTFSCRQAWIFVYSGADGRQLYRIQGRPPCDYLGIGMASPGDVTGDGIGDLVAISNFWSVQFYDGRDGAFLGELVAERVSGPFGYATESVGDINANGFGDVLVYAAVDEALPYPNNLSGPAHIWLVDGGTRDLLYRVIYPRSLSEPTNGFGQAFSACGDWNDDGQPDFAVAATEIQGRPVVGKIDVFSGHPFGVRSVPETCARRGDDLRIGSSGVPILGRDYPIHLTGVPPGTRAWLVVGSALLDGQRARLGSLGTGARGCGLRVRPDLVLPTVTVQAGGKAAAATAHWKITSDASLAGTKVYAQWLLPGSGLADATSRVLEITVQASEPPRWIP